MLLALFFLLAGVGYAQDVKNSTEGMNGAYGVVVSRIGLVRNSTAVFVGGRGGWIVNHTFAIGLGGYMLMNDVSARIPDTSSNRLISLEYGGLDLEYISPIGDCFLTLQTLVGAGSIGHKEIPYLNRRQYHDPFFVFEPSLNIEIGVTKIFRIGIGASYREVAWLNSRLASSADLSGPSGFLSLKLGFL
jgi:hypothetical protein